MKNDWDNVVYAAENQSEEVTMECVEEWQRKSVEFFDKLFGASPTGSHPYSARMTKIPRDLERLIRREARARGHKGLVQHVLKLAGDNEHRKI